MTEITTIARFSCGCIYKTVPGLTPMICTVHRRILTGIEHIQHQRGQTPKIQKMVMMKDLPDLPERLVNDKNNSLTKVVTVQGNGFKDEIYAEEGLCNACYIDDDETVSAHTPICGCPDLHCKYRWCGSTKGLHAFFRMHVRQDYQNLVQDEDEDGIHPEELRSRNSSFDQDIFAYGTARDIPQAWQDALNPEREKIRRAMSRLRTTVEKGSSLLWDNLGWLQKERPAHLTQQLTWLTCAGTLEIPQETGGQQLELL